MADTPKTEEEAVRRHIRARLKVPKERRFTTTMAGIYQVGGAWGVVDWAIARIEQNIGSPNELNQLRALIHMVSVANRMQWKRELAAFKEREKLEKAERKEQQELQQLALEVRALEQNQAPDPREVIRQRLIAAGVV